MRQAIVVAWRMILECWVSVVTAFAYFEVRDATPLLMLSFQTKKSPVTS